MRNPAWLERQAFRLSGFDKLIASDLIPSPQALRHTSTLKARRTGDLRALLSTLARRRDEGKAVRGANKVQGLELVSGTGKLAETRFACVDRGRAELRSAQPRVAVPHQNRTGGSGCATTASTAAQT